MTRPREPAQPGGPAGRAPAPPDRRGSGPGRSSLKGPRAAPGDDARGLRIGLLCSTFNAAVVDGLREGARAALEQMGSRQITVVEVPGAFELPAAARAAARSGRFDAIVALGAVIRGETDHYEHIAREAASGLAAVAREEGVPLGFGVLTVAEESQALARAGSGQGNKGAEAARAAVAMVHVLRRLGASGAGRHRAERAGASRRGR